MAYTAADTMSFRKLTADEAAEMIGHGDTVGFSGFTLAGDPKATARAIAAKARKEHEAGRPFRLGVISGASTGPSLDGELSMADAIAWRTPFQSNPHLRQSINAGKTRFFDMHLSQLPIFVRNGFLGKIHWAVIEVCAVHPDGRVVPTTAVGASPTFCDVADKVILELNHFHPAELEDIHDIYQQGKPPHRKPVPLENCRDRIGEPFIRIDPAKIAGIVHSNLPDEVPEFTPPSVVTAEIGRNVAEFLAGEMKAGRLPAGFLPVQSGIGNVANSVLAALGDHPAIPPFEMFTEVIQDSVIELIRRGRITFATGTSLRVSPPILREIYDNLPFYKEKIILRPQEITNSPELVARLGIIAVNTALEIDLSGHINSTHVMGKDMMNGIGGSGDFTRNAYLSIFTCPSLAKGGKISPIVPMVSHVDHNEHSVQVVVTENGVADLRAKSPSERAELVIRECAHPLYQEELRGYLVNSSGTTHTPATLATAFAMHQRYLDTGHMRGVSWDDASRRGPH